MRVLPAPIAECVIVQSVSQIAEARLPCQGASLPFYTSWFWAPPQAQ